MYYLFLSVIYPRFHNLGFIIKKFFVYLYADEQVNFFTPAAFVSFRSDYSLRNHLVHAIVCCCLRVNGSSGSGKSRCEMGSVVERFRFRWIIYKSSQRLALAGGTLKQKYFYKNFLRDNCN